MSERRPFPPSPRRLALARQAGLTPASPLVVGAIACIGALIAALALARAAAATLGAWIAAACRAADGSADWAAQRATGATGAIDDAAQHAQGVGNRAIDQVADHARVVASHAIDDAAHHAHTLAISDVAARVLELALPLLAVAALAAVVAHFAQTRALWLPRRRLANAPAVEPARVRRSALDLATCAAVGVVAFAWLWTTAPRLAALLSIDAPLAAVASAIASFIVVLAVTWIAVGTLDALLRRADLQRALAMTVSEKREDDRIAAADPRWRARRLELARGPSATTAVAKAAVLLLGDDIAVAIEWDARRQPVPARTITGRRARATQLLGLARRHRVPVHRDAQLAAALVDGDGPVPDTYWSRLAEIIAAVQAANTGRDVSR
ncbi:MAG TPA: EscU/YscU/HrcU family type III secretion system export apparatus switch protein [Kofleriaceae bacterium]